MNDPKGTYPELEPPHSMSAPVVENNHMPPAASGTVTFAQLPKDPRSIINAAIAKGCTIEKEAEQFQQAVVHPEQK